MRPDHTRLPLSRRDLLKLSGGAAAVLGAPTLARAQTPKRGGTLSLRLWDPPHWDPQLTVSYKTHVLHTFTHSRLLRHKAGPAVAPGVLQIEGDLAESWTQPNDTTYVFKLRRGVRWHNKPPVNGRELTSDDVKYSMERFINEKGNANRHMLASVDRIETPDKYTVRVILKEPFAWFLDMIVNPMAVCIVAKECVEKFGDLKKWEAVVGTGPWMLDSYRPNVGVTYVRNPTYFVRAALHRPGRGHGGRGQCLAHGRVHLRQVRHRLGEPRDHPAADWVQIKDVMKQRRPRLQTLEYAANR